MSSDRFDGWLERELQKSVGAQAGPSPLSSQSRYQAASARGGFFMFLSPVPAVVKAAVVVGAVLLVTAGGATAATGSTNPTVWGATVTTAVNECPHDLQSIGPCVSAIARTHGSGVHPSDHPTGRPTNHH